jgi:hypothetical protein
MLLRKGIQNPHYLFCCRRCCMQPFEELSTNLIPFRAFTRRNFSLLILQMSLQLLVKKKKVHAELTYRFAIGTLTVF